LQISQYLSRPFPNLAEAEASEADFANYQSYLCNGHVTSNPFEDRLQRESLSPPDGLLATQHLRDSVYMSSQLANLTSTLKGKKKMVCQGGHSAGPCQHSRRDSIQEEQLQNEEDFVFRAVSPHGHVYWEIDPSRADKLKPEPPQPTEFCLSGMSRQSSSRYSDNYPLIGHYSPAKSDAEATILVNPFADVHLISVNGDSLTSSPSAPRPINDVRFSSLRGNPKPFRHHLPPPYQPHFGTRAGSARTGRIKDAVIAAEQWRASTLAGNGSLSSSEGPSLTSVGSASSSTGSGAATTTSGSTSPTEAQLKEHLRAMNVPAKAGDYIAAKLHGGQAGRSTPLNSTVGSILNRSSPKQRKV
jgi:hypothetical protein